MTLFAHPCPWYIAGPLLGLLVGGLLWATNKPLGALGGYVDTASWLEHAEPGPTWRVFFLVGMVVGGALSGFAGGLHVPTFGYGSFNSGFGPTLGVGGAVLAFAGTLIGYGARRAGGCTSGHGMCGSALASPASLIATITFMATAVVMTNLLVRGFGVGS